MPVLRTALIGLGAAAEHIHLPACKSIPELHVIAACEPDAVRRASMQARFSIPSVYPDAHAMLQQQQPDLVIVITPPDTHHALVTLALQSGAHVLCEKPFMSNIDQADAVIALAQRHARLLRVNNQYRYMATYAVPYQQIARGDYGRAQLIECWQTMFHPNTTDKTAWRAELRQSTLYEFGSHALDLISHFFDDAIPTRVHAVIPSVNGYESDVQVAMTLTFDDRRLATILFNRVGHAPEKYLEMRVGCERASVRMSLGGVARLSAEIARYDGRNFPSLESGWVRGGQARIEQRGRSRVIASERRSAFASATAAHLRDMIGVIARGEIDNARARHARDMLRVIAAGYESARTGEVVTIAR